MIRFCLIFLVVLAASSPFIQAQEGPPPLLTLGGGYYDAGKNHSGSLFQAEYRFGTFCFCGIRPLVVVATPEFDAVFAGLGVGIEFHFTKRIILFPNVTPGAYFRGNGKDLGYPLEFRDCVEIAYEFPNCMRLGAQLFHISNAHLGDRNPGMNALLLYLAIPLDRQR